MAKRKGSVDACAVTETKKAKRVTKGTTQRKPKTPGSKKLLEGACADRLVSAVNSSKVPRGKKKKPDFKVPATADGASKQKSIKHEPKEEPTEIKIEDHDNKDTMSTLKDRLAGSVKKESSEEDSDEEEWEDVEELNEPVSFGSATSSLPKPVLPCQPVEIEIETPQQAKKRQRREKRKAEFETYLRRMMNRFNKDVVVDTHKVHLLCLLANGFFRNRMCSEPDLQAIALSIIPEQFTKVTPEHADVMYLSNLIKWFMSAFVLNPELSYDENESRVSALERRFGTFAARDHEEMTHLFLIILRALQLFCRLVLSLQPISLKGPPTKSKSRTSSRASRDSPGSSRKTKQAKKKCPVQKKGRAKGVEETSSDEESDGASEKGQGAKRAASGQGRSGKGAKKHKSSEEAGSDGNNQQRAAKEGVQRPKNARRRTVASKVSYKEESGNENSSDSEFELSTDTDFSEGGKSCTRKGKGQKSGPRKKKSVKREKETDKPPKDKRASQKGAEVLSDDDGDVKVVGEVSSRGTDQWLEVYLGRVGKWVCVDCVRPTVNQPQQCYKSATKPIAYIVGIDDDGFVKDITRRYDPAWMTSTRKHRVDVEWWEETLECYRSPVNEREKKEDLELHAQLLDQPLPTSISEYKNHPLYVLNRHLLKYEALYPPTAATLGYCRGEAVYSRDCVHTLHSRDTWLKEARVVRLGEVPYKMVKGFSNRSRKARLVDTESRDKDDLPLFGSWQTEEYQPPVAVDGKVPRNEYGNVYLFKPCMLPIGCVRMQVSNLHKVARKLGIDCAPAVTGFDFHCGFSHPVIEGYVVCEEYKEVLLAAWENEQAEMERKEKEKREKRVLANWTLLVKGLLIKERLKQRYGNQNEAKVPTGTAEGGGFSSDEEGPGSQSTAPDLACFWPQNRQAPEEEGGIVRKSKREKRGEQKNLFPFEKK
ncbi:DNA repair protein complementing XP-C cells-like [Acipenser ruthenus]|uniref:DNA repair protein complementing XP-C cells-like n=1 Tax=Acipenser ruthenus TaxID=7906 RepID=UPI00145BB938|nr:DNA repair protein complementing XP-C cells-like [Acipenser ruthenus]